MARLLSRSLLAAFFVLAGTMHFLQPRPYLAIMPPLIPWPETTVALSGLAEILGGLGLCLTSTRRVTCWGLIALLVAVFPANIYAISTGMKLAGHVVPGWALWARLPFQPLIIWWVYSARKA